MSRLHIGPKAILIRFGWYLSLTLPFLSSCNTLTAPQVEAQTEALGEGCEISNTNTGLKLGADSQCTYLEDVQERLAKYIRLAKDQYEFGGKGNIDISFLVNRKGEIQQLKVKDRRGDAILEKQLKQDITNASPLAPLPSKLNGDSILISGYIQTMY